MNIFDMVEIVCCSIVGSDCSVGPFPLFPGTCVPVLDALRILETTQRNTPF